MITSIKGWLRNIKLYLIGLKYRYIIKIIVMEFFEIKMKYVEYFVFRQTREALIDPAFIEREFENFRLIDMNISSNPEITVNDVAYTRTPAHVFNCNIPLRGIRQVYTFKYPIIEGYDQLVEITPTIRIINHDFDILVNFYIIDNCIAFSYDNWCSYARVTVETKARKIFDELESFIKSVFSVFNHYPNFEKNIRVYMNRRFNALNQLNQ